MDVESIMLLAQQTSFDPIGGGSGWVGAGLLGMVLSWLLVFHLPAKDKQIREVIADCDRHNEKIAVAFVDQLKTQQDGYRASLEFLAQQQERHVTLLADALRQELKILWNDK